LEESASLITGAKKFGYGVYFVDCMVCKNVTIEIMMFKRALNHHPQTEEA